MVLSCGVTRGGTSCVFWGQSVTSSARTVPRTSLASFLHQLTDITSTVARPSETAPDAETSVATPGVVAWRTRHLVAFLVILGLLLAGLTLVASQANPDVVDLGATRWIQQFRNPAFASLMFWVSWAGFAPQTWVLPVLVAAPFALRGLRVEAICVLATQAASLVAAVLKDIVDRARPSPELVSVLVPLNTPSFPSGHVVQYATLFGFTFFLIYVLAPRSWVRTLGLALVAVPVVLVGPSRLYLGQHWLSDVLGGYAVAAMLLLPLCWAYVKWRLEHARQRGRATL
jgi:membrane-associated phospholipid phosphatase